MNNRRKSPRLNPTVVTSLSSIKSSTSSSSLSDSNIIEPNFKRAKSKQSPVIPAKQTNKSNSGTNRKSSSSSNKNLINELGKTKKSIKTVTKSKSEISKRHYRKKARQTKPKKVNKTQQQTSELNLTANSGAQHQQQTSTPNTSEVLTTTRTQSNQQTNRVVNSNTIGPLSLNNESLISSDNLEAASNEPNESVDDDIIILEGDSSQNNEDKKV